ncbi:MAG: hypothetical protein K2X99_13400 [Gemmatimonadaceae bacterium]|nr:hypothetical protein [Gemmatimonadaceae bacterium]
MPSITGPFSSLILTIVFALMWRLHRERWLGLWAVASALWTVRYLASSTLGALDFAHSDQIIHGISLARNYYLLLGGYALVERPLPRPWYLLLGADALLLLWETQAGTSVIAGARGAPHYLLYGVTTGATAMIVYAQRARLGPESALVSGCLAIVGVSVGFFPWLRAVPYADPVIFSLVHAAQLGVGFGALLLFHRRAMTERDAALERLETALSKAIAKLLPICAHCKSIRNDQGEWEKLERYFSKRSITDFSHGICPDCVRTHYPGLELGESAGR